MAEEIPLPDTLVPPGTGPGPGGQQPNVQILLDERELRQVYINAYRIHATADEVVVDLGFNMPNPNPQTAPQQQLLLKITDRVIMSYSNAKRLAQSLAQLVQRYEQFGGRQPPR